jgi:aldose 1-epimerase
VAGAALTLASGDASAEIAPDVGGAIAAFRWRGQDVLRPTPASAYEQADVRQFASYPLVPFSNRVANAQLRVETRTHALAHNFGEHPHTIHGVGWQRRWRVESHSRESARIAFDHVDDEAAPSAWPFAFHAAQSFVLTSLHDHAVLTATLLIRNTGDLAFPFGLGWHPFFPRDAATTLGFTTGGMWATDSTCIPTEHRAVESAEAFDPPRAIGATALDNVFTGWNGVATIRWPRRKLAVSIEADRSCGHLVVYIPRDRDYLAIEPVTHMTDAFNRAARGERDTGTRRLAPGESRCCTMRIVASSDAAS